MPSGTLAARLPTAGGLALLMFAHAGCGVGLIDWRSLFIVVALARPVQQQQRFMRGYNERRDDAFRKHRHLRGLALGEGGSVIGRGRPIFIVAWTNFCGAVRAPLFQLQMYT